MTHAASWNLPGWLDWLATCLGSEESAGQSPSGSHFLMNDESTRPVALEHVDHPFSLRPENTMGKSSDVARIFFFESLARI
jgi:hypothetical protein